MASNTRAWDVVLEEAAGEMKLKWGYGKNWDGIRENHLGVRRGNTGGRRKGIT